MLSLGARQDAMRVMQGPWTPRCYCTVADLLRFIASHFITRVASRCVNTSRSPWRGRQSCAVAVRRVGTPTDTPPRECGRVACARCHSLGIIRTGLAQSKCYHRHAHDVHPHNPTLCGRASHLGSALLSAHRLYPHTRHQMHTHLRRPARFPRMARTCWARSSRARRAAAPPRPRPRPRPAHLHLCRL